MSVKAVSKKTAGILLLFVILLVAGFLLFPLPGSLADPASQAPVSVLDRSGKLLYEARQRDYGSQNALKLSDVPPTFLEALITVEDRTFRSHPGVSLRGIARAVVQNVKAGRVVSGGSTITQQFVRIRLRPEQRTFLYKLWEMLLALKLELKLSKDEILEQYVSSVYFGHQAYGLHSASRTYFGKEPSELSLGEIALLTGLVQSPVTLDPFSHLDLALERREIVLSALKNADKISEEEREQAASEPVSLAPDRIDIRAPHFVFWVLDQLPVPPEPGTEIRTTLDLDLQNEVEAIIERKVEELREKNVTSAAVVVLDAEKGDILAMVGSRDYFDQEHDGAVNVAVAARQPGSSLKPFTYALALAKGDTAASTVADTEVHLLTEAGDPYTPRNYDYDLHGLVRYREALANSYNIAAVKVLQRVSVVRLLDFLRVAGIQTLTQDPEFYGLALTLGSGEVRLLELVQAYGIFSRGGRTLIAHALLDDEASEGQQIIDPRVAWIISDILADPLARLPQFGEVTPLTIAPHRIAAKTGTTRNARDNWVLGVTPERIVGVWVGNADNTPMKGTSGITGAGPIFHDVFEAVLQGREPKDFPKPPGIVRRTICRTSGKLPTPACPHTIDEYFIEGTEPRTEDDIHRTISIDRRNGLRAGEDCDEAFVLEEHFTVFPPDVRAWAREHGYREPPTAFSPLCPDRGEETSTAPSPDDQIKITRPQTGDSFLLDPLIPDENERITFLARAPQMTETVDWLVDGESIGKGLAPDFRMQWQPVAGKHTIAAIAGNERDTVTITVEEP